MNQTRNQAQGALVHSLRELLTGEKLGVTCSKSELPTNRKLAFEYATEGFSLVRNSQTAQLSPQCYKPENNERMHTAKGSQYSNLYSAFTLISPGELVPRVSRFALLN